MRSRSKWVGLFGIILALVLVTCPFVGSALAAADDSDPHAGHDMSTMNNSEQQSNDHDMSNMDSTNETEISTDNSSGHSQHDSTSNDVHSSAGSGSHDSSSGGGHDSSGSSHDSGGDRHEASGGHGEGSGDPNTPPNWPVIYGFGAFNLLVIIAAAIMKTKA
ncbi:hypothetical protein JCM14036_12180 [Desulfotomaculum defluvii]